MPMTAEDLDRHRIVTYSDGPLTRITNPSWLLKSGADPKNPRRPAFRVNNILGMLRAVERGIEDHVPARWQRHAHHWLILHGRYICVARKPKCPICPIRDLCLFEEKTL